MGQFQEKKKESRQSKEKEAKPVEIDLTMLDGNI